MTEGNIIPLTEGIFYGRGCKKKKTSVKIRSLFFAY